MPVAGADQAGSPPPARPRSRGRLPCPARSPQKTTQERNEVGVMLFTVSVSGVGGRKRPVPKGIVYMQAPSTRVSPSSSSRGTRGLLLRRGLVASLVDSGFSTPTVNERMCNKHRELRGLTSAGREVTVVCAARDRTTHRRLGPSRRAPGSANTTHSSADR
ncbi:hypothetical protein HU200_066402 [Digitaria exilis]|uniref:Uncharacterized protein n=1 Tax=Digitaria exilis TaxID=1010633 RepID=A0A835DU02_9POAL|nr:hypothetical protein HU200_066402 [Digitaria exilis]